MKRQYIETGGAKKSEAAQKEAERPIGRSAGFEGLTFRPDYGQEVEVRSDVMNGGMSAEVTVPLLS